MVTQRTNNVVEKMNKGEKAYGMNMIFPSTTIVELAGRAGFDFVTFDSEHGPFTIDILDDLCRIADMAELTPFARVPNIDCLLYTSPSPRDRQKSRMPSSA